MPSTKKRDIATYTVHGHFQRPDGRLEAFWTRTGLTKFQAQKLARDQRAESGGVAKVVVESSSHATKKRPAQLDREIAESIAKATKRSHATTKAEAVAYAEQIDRQLAPTLGKTRAQIVRRINAIVRAADGRNVYAIRHRLGDQIVDRITRARTKDRGVEARVLATGHWLPMSPELGDRFEIR